MAYFKKKLKLLEKALGAWGEALKEPYSTLVRDATIQRYEFTFELLWKVVKLFLLEHEGVSCNSPKSCFRALKTVLKLTESEVELCLQMTQDRNLSVHTYSEKFAQALYRKTKKYFKISQKILNTIQNNL
jgi:nucleotidyltransferase substrate binding protein (TIGR01987 family)